MRLFIGLIISVLSAGVCQAQDAVSEKWELVWADEFEGNSLDTNKWSYETDCWGGGNNERQCYTNSKKNIAVKDGALKITARRKRTTGHARPATQRKTRKQAKQSATLPYSSGRIRTIGKGDWRYGKIEARAKLPSGQGVWPAIWMLSSDEHYGGWASSGEIDIMEAVNLGTKCDDCEGGIENRVLGTLHYGDEWPNNQHRGTDTALPNAIDDYHVYGIEWITGSCFVFNDAN